MNDIDKLFGVLITLALTFSVISKKQTDNQVEGTEDVNITVSDSTTRILYQVQDSNRVYLEMIVNEFDSVKTENTIMLIPKSYTLVRKNKKQL